jgi:hypothetical protein
MPAKSEESMEAHEVRAVVAVVLAEQKRQHDQSIDEMVSKTVVAILRSIGIEEGDGKQLQADFIYLRRLRKSFEQASNLTFKIVLTTVVVGFLTALVAGLKMMFNK